MIFLEIWCYLTNESELKNKKKRNKQGNVFPLFLYFWVVNTLCIYYSFEKDIKQLTPVFILIISLFFLTSYFLLHTEKQRC